MTPEERKKVNPKVVFFAGKAAPGCKPSYLATLSTTLIDKYRLHREAHHPPYYQRRARHQRRPGHQGPAEPLLPARLLCLARRDPHPRVGHQPAHLHGRHRGLGHLEHEVLSERRPAARHSR